MLDFTDQPVYEATNPTDASNKTDPSRVACENDHMPCPFDIKITRDTNTKTKDLKDPLLVNPYSPKAAEEQGNSIAKVLEWFRRSSDSSDKLDCEGFIPDTEDDIKVEDIDFENEINLRPKAENNVYLIIPKHQDEDMMNDGFLKDRDLAVELNVNKKEPFMNFQNVQDLSDHTKPLNTEEFSAMGSSNLFRHRSSQDTVNRLLDSEKPSPKENVLETASKKENSRNDEKTKPTQLKLQEVSQSPKVTNLRSQWDQGTIKEPVQVSKPNLIFEKETIDQHNDGRKVIEVEKEPTKVDMSPKYSVTENKKHVNKSHVKDISNVGEIQADNISYEHLNKKESDRDKVKDMQAPTSNINQIKDIMALSDKDVTKCLGQRSSSSQDFRLQIVGDHSDENIEGNRNSTMEGCTTAAVLELDPKVKTEEKESQLKPPPTSGVQSQQQNPVPLAKQSKQHQNNKAERIKELKSFWEREKLQSNIYNKSTAANSSATSTKLNKRFTKSEYDLRSIGTESELESANFTVLPLRDRIEKTVTGEGMNSLQFKMLRDFWAESSKQSSSFENKTQNPLSQEVKHPKTHKEVSQFELVDASPNQSEKGFGNDSGNIMPPKVDRGSSKEKTAVIYPDIGTTANSPTEPDVLRSSHCPQPKNGSKLSPKDTSSPRTQGMLNKEFRNQTRSSGKGTLNGRANSLRRATSMFAINVESQGEDLPSQSMKVSDAVLPQTTESTVSPSTKTPEVNLQVKKSPEMTESKHKATDRSVSEDPDSQPLARSFVPRDYQHYLGITENRGKHISPQGTEQKSELVCTSFQTGGSVRCCPEKADVPIDDAELCTKRGSWGLRPSAHTSEEVKPMTLNRDDSFSGTSANCKTYILFGF